MNVFDRFSSYLSDLQSQRSSLAGYNYPIIEKGGKIGIHSLQPADCVKYTRQLHEKGGRFPVVKAVGDIDWLAEIKAIDPEIITIARFEIPGNIGEGVNGIQEVNDGDYSRFVDTLLYPIQIKLRERPDFLQLIDYWEICNEPDPPGADGWRKLAECMIECIKRADQMGINLAIFALNAGTPEWWEILAAVETGVFGYAKAGGHILTCHEAIFGFEKGAFNNPVDLWYGHPIPANEEASRWVQVFEDGLQYFDWAGREEDRPDWWEKGIGGPLLYRYRFLYALLHERNEVIPVVISEIVYGGNYSDVDDVRRRVEWYDAKSSDDYYVLAHLPFTLGGYGFGWEKQEYSYAYPTFIDYMADTQNRPNADEPMFRTIDYKFKLFLPQIGLHAIPNRPEPNDNRVVVLNLLPTFSTTEEVIKVIEVSHSQKESIIFSAHDARTLVSQGGEGSYVKAWQATGWHGNLRKYMADWYVDVEYYNLLTQSSGQATSNMDLLMQPMIVNLLPPSITLDEKRKVVLATVSSKQPICQSADDAVSMVKLGGANSYVQVWNPDKWAGDILAYLSNNQVAYQTKFIES